MTGDAPSGQAAAPESVGSVSVRRLGDVALVRIGATPGGAAERLAGLGGALDAVAADQAVHAVVLAGLEDVSPGDPDLPLAQAADRIEASEKPVVACLDGTVFGAGFELALAAHWRLASAGVQLGFPDIALGLMPGAGGTQRLARLAGARVALDLTLSGRPIGAEAAESAGLIDGVLLGNVEDAAVRLAENLAEKGFGRRPSSERRDGFADPAAYLDEIAARRKTLATARNPAERRIVDCVEAALLLPPDEGLRFERISAEECRASPESRALRHAARAEARVIETPERAAVGPRVPNRAGIVDGGAVGSNLAVALLDAELPVALLEHDGASRDAALARIKAAYASAVEAGRLPPEAAVERIRKLTVSVDPADLSSCDIVVEVPGDVPLLRRQILTRVEGALSSGAVLATLNPDFAPGADAVPRLPGLHFLGPVRAARAVEVAVGPETAPDAVMTAFGLVEMLGRIAVRSGAREGLIGNRVYAAGLLAADRLLAEGAAVEEVDAAMRGAGFALGPYQLTDLAGLDTAWSALARRRAAALPEQRRLELSERLIEAGRVGRRAGRGYYRYAQRGGRGQADPVVSMLLAEERAKRGAATRPVAETEIRRRLLLAMAGEGARLVSEGVALRPSDVDVVMLHGFGFPRWLGGPMQWADETGLLGLREELRRWAEEAPDLWAPAPVWDELIKNGRRFADFDAVLTL